MVKHGLALSQNMANSNVMSEMDALEMRTMWTNPQKHLFLYSHRYWQYKSDSGFPAIFSDIFLFRKNLGLT